PRLQPNPIHALDDATGVRHSVHQFLRRDAPRAAGRQGGAGGRQPALDAPLRRCAADPAYSVQVRNLLAVRVRVPPRRIPGAFLARRRGSRRFPELPRRAILVAAFSGDPDLANGAVSRLRDGPRAQYTVRRRRAAATVPALALVRGQAHKAPTYPPARAAQPADRGQSGRGHQREGLARAHRAGRDPARACGAARREAENGPMRVDTRGQPRDARLMMAVRCAIGSLLLALHIAVPLVHATTNAPTANGPLRVVTTPIAPFVLPNTDPLAGFSIDVW